MESGDFTRDLEAVARGLKTLAQIEDPDRRAAIELALRLRAAGEDTPDAGGRARMRRRILAQLPPPRGRRVSERLYQLLTWIAVPAPYALRVAAIVLVLGGLIAGATVASADSLPDEPLYALKIASEELRLALAATPEDRATVELSIAEHRLFEAERLATAGRDDAAIVATSEYGSHLANAAAELASVENLAPGTAALVGQLEHRLQAHQTQIATTATQLAKDPSRSSAAAVLSAVSATARPVPGPTDRPAARIAANAAAVAARVSEVADARVAALAPVRPGTPADAPRQEAIASPRIGDVPRIIDAPRVTEGPRITDPPRATPARPTDGPRATEPSRAAVAPTPAAPTPERAAGAASPVRPAQAATPAPSAHAAADAARKAAEAAKQAAERAKQAAQRTPPPHATPQRR